ncbi:MAG TPA: hypothetical protein VFU73_11790 [Actinocrinis sp.]|nr:hypothetical protein [Actinocrinis sp.]
MTVGAALAAVILLAGWGIAEAGHPASASSPGTATVTGDPLATSRIDLKPGPADAALTARGDLSRLGWDQSEAALSPTAVASGSFGRRAAFPVDGKIYAQPLYAPGLTIGGASHDVVIAATEHDSVYAFDAHAASNAAPLWHTSLLMPGARTFQAASDRVAAYRLCDSIVPEVGITSTPVIDWGTKTLYVMALDVEHGTTMTYRLHALDLLTGRDKLPSTVVTASVPGKGLDSANGTIAFAASDEQQRLALTEVGGIVYAGFASWCGLNPYHGWLLGYDVRTLHRTIVYNASPDQYAAGFWESEAGLGADGHGHLYAVTGNGPFDLDTGGRDVGDTVLELAPADGTLRQIDSFTPFDQRCLAEHDQDLGSGSPLMVPGHHELILSSKTGVVYVLDEASLGGYRTAANPCATAVQSRTDVDHIKQELPQQTVPGGMWGTWAYAASGTNEYVYAAGAQGPLTQWRLAADGTLVPTPVARAPLVFAYPGAIPVVTSDGSAPGSGIVWTVDQTHGAVLRAFAADDVSHELWDSGRDPGRDALGHGEFDHFTVPTTADGVVIVGDQGHLELYAELR